MELREIGWGGMNWIHLAQDRDQSRALVNTVMKVATYTVSQISSGLRHTLSKYLERGSKE
jgi:hypothetical protein